jgi:signal transduction histidine kinase
LTVRKRGHGDGDVALTQAADGARPARIAIVAVKQRPPAVSERERRWLWVTEVPFLVCALAALVWLPTQRALSPLLCLALVAGYAVAGNVSISLRGTGYASSVQLVFVPMLFLAPLNLVALMVLAGCLVEHIGRYLRHHRPLARCIFSLGNSWWVLGPVLVLAAAGHDTFGWEHWPVYVIALAAQLVLDSVVGCVRVRFLEGEWWPLRVVGAAALVDVALSLPALAAVAAAGDAPVGAVLILVALLAIAGGFTSQRSGRVAERELAMENARRVLLDERVRIARELHDVVAHHVSLMGVQAGAARVVLGRDPAKAKHALASIESSSRQAVGELHRLLGFLRQAGDSDDLAPQPGLGQLETLAAAMSDSQLTVDVRIQGQQRPLSPTIDVSAYRIVQEALTNTLKHAGASRANVDLRYHPGDLEIEVTDNGHGNSGRSSASGAGLGLVGMRERAGLHDGTLTAGPIAGGGYAVRVTLPVPVGS